MVVLIVMVRPLCCVAQFGSREREKEKKINTRGGVKRGCWVLVSRAARA